MCLIGVKSDHKGLAYNSNDSGGLAFSGGGYDNTAILTNNDNINSLLLGSTWSNLGAPATITWSFDVASPAQVNQEFRTAAQSALNTWSNVANITFVEQSPSPQTNPNVGILFSQVPLDPGFLGQTFLFFSGNSSVSKGTTNASDIEINNSFSGASLLPGGDNGFLTIIHEIGHALGLKHVGSDGVGGQLFPFLPLSLDNVIYSVMSYKGLAQPITPMTLDIAAIQYLYGANTSFNSGNTTYVLDGSQVKTIWDGGGVDTYDVTGFAGDSIIDIRSGQNSLIGNAVVGTAIGANIENVIAQDGNNAITANALNNFVASGRGNDFLSLGAGDDMGSGGKDNDTIQAGKGNDFIVGNMGNDVLSGKLGDDFLGGGKDADVLFGDAGNDILSGDLGNDILNGGSGSDIFQFRSDSGIDVIEDFVSGSDVLQIIGIFQSLSAALAAFNNGILDLGNGNTVALTGVDTLISSDILLG